MRGKVEIEHTQLTSLTNLLSDLFHLNAGNDDVLFLPIDVLDLFLKNKTSSVQITLRNEVVI